MYGKGVWGAPDLVLEVESRRTMRRDRTTKLKWYRQYGVRECWLVAPQTQTIVVVSMNGNQRTTRRRFRGDARVESAVLPAFHEPASAFFD